MFRVNIFSSSSLIALMALGLLVVIGTMLSNGGSFVEASGKKKFIKGFILGALLGKSHYPVVYSVPSHGGGGGHSYGGGHGGGSYGGWA